MDPSMHQLNFSAKQKQSKQGAADFELSKALRRGTVGPRFESSLSLIRIFWRRNFWELRGTLQPLMGTCSAKFAKWFITSVNGSNFEEHLSCEHRSNLEGMDILILSHTR